MPADNKQYRPRLTDPQVRDLIRGLDLLAVSESGGSVQVGRETRERIMAIWALLTALEDLLKGVKSYEKD